MSWEILKDKQIINYLKSRDPYLIKVFKEVKDDAFDRVFEKSIFVILIGALIGQRIKYVTAKKYRKEMYELLGDNFTPEQLLEKLDILTISENKKTLIKQVSNYVIENNLTFDGKDSNKEKEENEEKDNSDEKEDKDNSDGKEDKGNSDEKDNSNGKEEPKKDNKEIVAEINSLINCKGIGPWTIKTVLLTSMMDPDIFPETDKFLEQKISKLYNIKATKRTVLNISSRWTPYKSVVTWYLWRWFD